MIQDRPTSIDIASSFKELLEFVEYLDDRFEGDDRLRYTAASISQRLAFSSLRILEDSTTAEDRMAKDVYFALDAIIILSGKQLRREFEQSKKYLKKTVLDEFGERFEEFQRVSDAFLSIRVSQVFAFRFRPLFESIRKCAELTAPNERSLFPDDIPDQSSTPDNLKSNSETILEKWKHLMTVDVAASVGGLAILIIAFFLLPHVGITGFWLRLAVVLLPASLVPFVLIWFRTWTWYRRMTFAILFLYMGSLAISEITFRIKGGPVSEIGMIVDTYNTSPLTIVCVTLLSALFAVLDFLDRRSAESSS